MSNVNPGPAIQGATNQIILINGMQLLWACYNANLAIPGDQIFTKIFSGLTWDPYFIVANYVSGAFNTTCTGGVYSAASKGGSQIVPSTTSYSSLTGPLTHTNVAITSSTTTFNQAPYLNMTTPNSGALLCDYLIFGFSYDR